MESEQGAERGQQIYYQMCVIANQVRGHCDDQWLESEMSRARDRSFILEREDTERCRLRSEQQQRDQIREAQETCNRAYRDFFSNTPPMNPCRACTTVDCNERFSRRTANRLAFQLVFPSAELLEEEGGIPGRIYRIREHILARQRPHLALPTEEEAALARASSDPQVVANQASIDAQIALNAHIAAAQTALDAQVAASRDPQNIELATDRDRAAQLALDAQIAANRANMYLLVARDAVQLATTRTHYENIIAVLRESHAEEIRAYRAMLMALCQRFGIALPEDF